MNQISSGKFIARKRKEQNLTQEQLAERLGVSNKTISKWETGKCMPDYAVVKSLCEELKVSVSELMDGEEALQALSHTFGGSDVKDFFSGLLLGLSVAEMLLGIYVTAKGASGK